MENPKISENHPRMETKQENQRYILFSNDDDFGGSPISRNGHIPPGYDDHKDSMRIMMIYLAVKW